LCQGEIVSSENSAQLKGNQILWNGVLYKELLFEPQNEDASFTLKDVVIGINFHWERKEDQQFQGALKLIVENNMITAINLIKVEDYLTSVISSEMSATASLELLESSCCHIA
jgi:Stage II sporulation protein.